MTKVFRFFLKEFQILTNLVALLGCRVQFPSQGVRHG
jgi:hypothetical protein